LPSAGIFTHDQLIETRRIWGGKDYQFSDEQFSAPIQKAYITNENGIERKVILLRVLNRMDQKIYREAIYFFTFGFSSVRSFGLDYTPESKRIISSLYMYLTKQKLERFWRLVHHQPVGLIEKEHLIDFIEGPRFMKDGKSVLELI
jgi:hypothetical protein